MDFIKNSHCSFCGALFLEQVNWPRKCVVCQFETYSNPLPVSVTFVDVWTTRTAAVQAGTLIQKRNIQPKKGEWALSGGYINAFEKWQDAAARELFEELGLTVSPQDIKLFDVVDDDKNHLLVFNHLKRPVYLDEIKFEPNDEVSEIKVIHHSMELAFPIHTLMLKRYINERWD